MKRIQWLTQAYIITIFIIISSSNRSTSSAQDVKASREARFYSYLGLSGLVRGGAVEPHWMGNGDKLWYVDDGPSGQVIVRVDPERKVRQAILEASSIRKALAAKLGRELPADIPDLASVSLEVAENQARFQAEGKTWVYDVRDGTLTVASDRAKPDAPRQIRAGRLWGEPAVMEVASPDGLRFASERNHNLFIRRAGGEEGELLSDDGRPDEAWSVEFARWSPDGTRLAATRSDQRCVPSLPVVRYGGKACRGRIMGTSR